MGFRRVRALPERRRGAHDRTRPKLVKDVPAEHAEDLDYLIDQLDWEANVDPDFKANHYLAEPIPVGDTAALGYQDRWVVYGRVAGRSGSARAN